jgi:hypothetical protein
MLILECSQGCYGRTDGRKEGRTVGGKIATSCKKNNGIVYKCQVA